jgi:hypothetical protein
VKTIEKMGGSKDYSLLAIEATSDCDDECMILDEK